MAILDNPRWEKFCQLLDQGDINQTDAYYDAGYECETREAAGAAACRLLKNVQIVDRLKELRERTAARYEVTRDKITAELAKLAFSNPLDYARIDDDGNPIVDLSSVTRRQGAAIKEFHTVKKVVRRGRGEDAEEETTYTTKIRISDKERSLELLGKDLGMFKTQTEMSGPNGGPINMQNTRGYSEWTDEELEKLEAVLLGRAASTQDPNA